MANDPTDGAHHLRTNHERRVNPSQVTNGRARLLEGPPPDPTRALATQSPSPRGERLQPFGQADAHF